MTSFYQSPFFPNSTCHRKSFLGNQCLQYKLKELKILDDNLINLKFIYTSIFLHIFRNFFSLIWNKHSCVDWFVSSFFLCLFQFSKLLSKCKAHSRLSIPIKPHILTHSFISNGQNQTNGVSKWMEINRLNFRTKWIITS